VDSMLFIYVAATWILWAVFVGILFSAFEYSISIFKIQLTMHVMR